MKKSSYFEICCKGTKKLHFQMLKSFPTRITDITRVTTFLF